jgi:hypothetical protein
MRHGHSAVRKSLLEAFDMTRCPLILHELLKYLTWIGSTYSSDAPPLRDAFHHNVLGTDDVVEILEYLLVG